MYENFVRRRISELRINKGVTEYKMSFDIGKSRSYIYNISSGQGMPSLKELFVIMDYFNVTPVEFFNERNNYPDLTEKILDVISELKRDDIEALLIIIDKMRLMREIINDLSPVPKRKVKKVKIHNIDKKAN